MFAIRRTSEYGLLVLQKLRAFIFRLSGILTWKLQYRTLIPFSFLRYCSSMACFETPHCIFIQSAGELREIIMFEIHIRQFIYSPNIGRTIASIDSLRFDCSQVTKM